MNKYAVNIIHYFDINMEGFLPGAPNSLAEHLSMATFHIFTFTTEGSE